MVGGVYPSYLASFINPSVGPASHEDAFSPTSDSSLLSHDDRWSLSWVGYDFT